MLNTTCSESILVADVHSCWSYNCISCSYTEFADTCGVCMRGWVRRGRWHTFKKYGQFLKYISKSLYYWSSLLVEFQIHPKKGRQSIQLVPFSWVILHLHAWHDVLCKVPSFSLCLQVLFIHFFKIGIDKNTEECSTTYHLTKMQKTVRELATNC